MIEEKKGFKVWHALVVVVVVAAVFVGEFYYNKHSKTVGYDSGYKAGIAAGREDYSKQLVAAVVAGQVTSITFGNAETGIYGCPISQVAAPVATSTPIQ